MLADKALELIRELDRTKDGQMPAFNEDTIRIVLEEMNTLFEQNQRDVNATVAGDVRYFSGVHLRHAALERNRRCLLAYLYNRLERVRDMRWEFGSILPADIRANMCEPEIIWFNKYNKNLASYMRSLGEGTGLDLTQDIKPPKNLYIEVRCLQDYGEFEIEEGDTVVLQKNTTHYLPMAQCQHLIRQGILEHVE
ncbi:DNA replication complex GINS protein PSF1 isoform X1 [Penaeus vannamei]|uniref:DNA replication complex GINS protein PSF1 n=2 Tax=Penaeus vannamei TaxID=6689 RepID=A0A3R7PNL8_PENVA|nr:DNA replication complex GINS protein PSF1-like isoform X1 [Penaeus vannamei]ROT72272.1 putative DNA replication complex GINS protein PSF1-like [Penaeus vannamei]